MCNCLCPSNYWTDVLEILHSNWKLCPIDFIVINWVCKFQKMECSGNGPGYGPGTQDMQPSEANGSKTLLQRFEPIVKHIEDRELYHTSRCPIWTTLAKFMITHSWFYRWEREFSEISDKIARSLKSVLKSKNTIPDVDDKLIGEAVHRLFLNL